MAAQYDLTWSEEAITGWHFYDTAQSLLYAAKGFCSTPAKSMGHSLLRRLYDERLL